MNLNSEINKELNAIKLAERKTNLSKEAFIQEIKNGLGEEIKKNPNKVIINKKESKLMKIINKIKRFFYGT